jgi:antitoxin (DNA-binding transcriptional repressor) of toxin-antitoxin stability system
MAKFTILEAQRQVPSLVKRAQLGEQIVLTTNKGKKPVVMIVAIKPLLGASDPELAK